MIHQLPQKIRSSPIAKEVIKFGIVGVANTCIDFSVYILLTRTIGFFGRYLILANIISFLVAVTNSYYWNRRWTFRSNDAKRVSQYSKFLIVNLFGMAINTGVLSLLVYKGHLYDVFAKICAVVVAMFWNYIINKIWVFRTKGNLPTEPKNGTIIDGT